MDSNYIFTVNFQILQFCHQFLNPKNTSTTSLFRWVIGDKFLGERRDCLFGSIGRSNQHRATPTRSSPCLARPARVGLPTPVSPAKVRACQLAAAPVVPPVACARPPVAALAVPHATRVRPPLAPASAPTVRAPARHRFCSSPPSCRRRRRSTHIGLG